jgi:3-dehydroquinate synthase
MIEVSTSGTQYVVEFVDLPKLKAGLNSSDVIVTDSNLDQLYQWSDRVVVIPAGEASKSFRQFESVVQQVLDFGLRRNGRLVAIGGGVVGDLAGLVAATVHRGVGLWQVPTSLLAMVDSSVGGKVGIDLPHGKNLLGALKNPERVSIAPDFLHTLPTNEFANGMAEVIKYAMITDSGLGDRLRREPLKPESGDLAKVIATCVRIKRDVVEADFEERSGVRATLNFGHTVGHALEQLGGYEEYSHGEAVAIGMVAEMVIAQELELGEPPEQELAWLLTQHGLPVRPKSEVDLADLERSMLRDKKNIGDGLSMSLVLGIGECKLVHGLEPQAVVACLRRLWS